MFCFGIPDGDVITLFVPVAYGLQDYRDGTGIAPGMAYELTEVASVRFDMERDAMDPLLGLDMDRAGIVHQGSDDEH